MLKIVISGPESSGKTKLAEDLAQHYSAPLVHEFAREYIDGLNRPYVEDDLIQIALGQTFAEDAAQAKGGRMMICDTDLLTVRIWSKEKYGQFNKKLNPLWFDDLPDLYLVCYPDLPWEPDPQREHPEDRERLFDIHVHEIERAKVNHAFIKGNDRIDKAIKVIDEFLEWASSR